MAGLVEVERQTAIICYLRGSPYHRKIYLKGTIRNIIGTENCILLKKINTLSKSLSNTDRFQPYHHRNCNSRPQSQNGN